MHGVTMKKKKKKSWEKFKFGKCRRHDFTKDAGEKNWPFSVQTHEAKF